MLAGTDWLTGELGRPNLVVVDMRWREDGSARELYEAGHIPGAVFLDWTSDIVDPDSPLAFMLAPPERFAAAMEARGIGDGTTVVAYSDRHGSGPYRLWWGSRLYGHDEVMVLDGGLDKWVAEERPVTDLPPRPPQGVSWTPRPGLVLAAGTDDVMAARGGDAVVLDSRPEEQFRGRTVWFERGPVAAGPDGVALTPRGVLRAGRVPWARNVPAASLYRDDFTMKPPDELRELLARVGADPSRPALTYCGVGISAAALLFAMNRVGFDDVRLYDASWEEWGRDPSLPVARG